MVTNPRKLLIRNIKHITEDFIANKVRILLEGLEEIRDNIAVRNGTAAVFLISLFMSNILYILGGWIL